MVAFGLCVAATPGVLICARRKAAQGERPVQPRARRNCESLGFEVEHERHSPAAALAYRRITSCLQPYLQWKRRLIYRNLEATFFSLQRVLASGAVHYSRSRGAGAGNRHPESFDGDGTCC